RVFTPSIQPIPVALLLPVAEVSTTIVAIVAIVAIAAVATVRPAIVSAIGISSRVSVDPGGNIDITLPAPIPVSITITVAIAVTMPISVAVPIPPPVPIIPAAIAIAVLRHGRSCKYACRANQESCHQPCSSHNLLYSIQVHATNYLSSTIAPHPMGLILAL